ncbi:sugar phosphate nucleotidyltransferase [uncultured Croceitalea sp.]|uniref:sugar phosphate nucleotidyltransferase n=1 Tax=uncultured Croceitalea sp. TaxID=1798908 RepID=UPI003305B40C
MLNNIIILAGGASSRMKKETANKAINKTTIAQANTRNKGLIEIGPNNIPFLDYLLYNIKQAGYQSIFIVIGANDTMFPSIYGSKEANNTFNGLNISYVRQHIPEGRTKPFGTADAVFQAMEQYPKLKTEAFAVCNCDNLYSIKVLRQLRQTNSKNALMGYDRDALKFDEERIAKFALMKLGNQNRLLTILEKPRKTEVDHYRDPNGKLRVSMNIFKFDGKQFYPFLLNCPVHPERNEKELPTALLNMVHEYPKSVEVIPVSEHVIDLTSKEDIGIVNTYLEDHYPNDLVW